MNPATNNPPRWLIQAFSVLLLLVAANLLSHRSVDPDLWGHIQFGEDWLTTGTLPRTATHTYSAQDHRWINHENLSELILALAQRSVGGRGIMILRTLAGLGVLALMLRIAVRRGVPQLAAAAMMIPVAHALAEFWVARPQLGSFICFAGLCVLLERAFSEWQTEGRVVRGWLLAAIPLMAVWVNLHGGFAAGLSILLAVLGLRLVECRLRFPDRFSANLKLFAGVGGLSVAAVLFNPYGIDLPLWMYYSVGTPRPEINEWASILDGRITIVPFTILTTLTFASMLLSTRPKDLVQFAVIGLVTVQAWLHLRHLAFEALLVGFWMPEHIWSSAQRIHRWWRGRFPAHAGDRPLSRRDQWLLGGKCAVVFLLLAGMLVWKTVTFGVSRAEFPVSALQYMADRNLTGRLLVSFDWAQYALAALSPDTTVGFDGRFRTCYPQQVIDMTFDLTNGTDDLSYRHRNANSGPPDPLKALHHGDPNLVLLSRVSDPRGVAVMEQQSDWVLLYQDQISLLWGRSDIYDNPDSDSFVPPRDRVTSRAVQAGVVEWPAFPGRTGRLAFAVTSP